MSESDSMNSVRFACPRCNIPLLPGEDRLQCSESSRICPITGEIPDFLSKRQLAGAAHSSLQSIENFISEVMKGVTGSVLDVACRPATYGYRIISQSRFVYGVNFSMGTPRQGMINITRDGVIGVCLARARVKELPFENVVFDDGICGESLHLFPDTVLALCGIN